MASTNTNTENKNLLNTDVYDIAEFYDQIRRDNISNLDDTNSMVGIFGYMNEMFTQQMQNSLIVISENTNESIATRAKFTKNVISHAMNLGITDICAIPAYMTMMIYLPISYIEQNFVELDSITERGKFILSKECPIRVGDFEFHLDYDIIFTRFKNPQNNYVYTAIYDLFEPGTTNIKRSNPISDITNPYITTVVQTKLNGDDYLAFSARLHQVTTTVVEKNILTNNPIENKTVTFNFRDQLAAFNVDVIENNTVTHLTPVYSGLLDYTLPDGAWCNYNYVNENTIRILFSRDSYVPAMNAIVRINIQTCEGSNGNFTYTNSFRTSLKSDTYNDYNGMHAYIYPLGNGISSHGRDKKSVRDLKKIIPREASSRGAVINTTDLNNFFNSINDDQCKLYFKKKKDNQFERMYYTYMLMRKNGYVYPTNTLNAKINQADFKGFAGSNNLVIAPGTRFYYYDHRASGSDEAFATIVPPEIVPDLDQDLYPYPMVINADGNLVRLFEYVTPFMISIDDDLISSYMLTVMNENKTFAFDSINVESDLQFVATNMNWRRNYLYTDEDGNECVYDNKYYMTVNVTQNNTKSDYKLVQYHYDANNEMVFDDIRVRMLMVLYADETETNPYRYIEANLIEFTPNDNIYTFRFEFGTDDLMDLNNRINITGVYNCKPEEYQLNYDAIIAGTRPGEEVPEKSQCYHGYMNKNSYAKIFILADFGTKPGDIVDGKKVTEESAEIILYGEDGIGNRTEINKYVPRREDIVDAFLKNDIYIEKYNADGVTIEQVNVVSIIKNNEDYRKYVIEWSGSENVNENVILRYLRNNKDSAFVQNELLQNESAIEVIESYNYEDLSRYTLCNTMSVDEGIDFYHDYSAMMRSTIVVKLIQATDDEGNLLYNEIKRVDATGKEYSEFIPIYLKNDNDIPIYNYEVKRIPLLKADYLTTEEQMQEYIYDLEIRRKYIEECLYVLEDTFDIDLKFFNTYGPSKMFYYNIPSSQNYNVKIAIHEIKILSETRDEDDSSKIIGYLKYGREVSVTKVDGIWGRINIPSDYINNPDYEPMLDEDGEPIKPTTGWIKLADTTKVINYIDNVALTMKFALEAETSADKYVSEDIIYDIKEYIEDINEINELHIPNIITLITNNYREQLVYFEFLDVNQYGAACQHLYLDEKISADICPEFLNIATTVDGTRSPDIDIAVY